MSREYNPSPEGNASLLARRNRFQTALVKFIGKRTPKCREVARILSQSMDSRLRLGMRIKLRLHCLICAWCRRYERDLRDLRKFASSLPDHTDAFSQDTLSSTAKDRMKRRCAGLVASNVLTWPATKIAKAIRSREISCEELIRAYVGRIEAVNPKLNSAQQAQGDKLAQVLKEKGINVQGIDVIASENTNSKAPQNLEIRYSKAADQGSFLSGLAETVKKSVGRESKLVDLSAGRDPLTYEIWPPQY